MSDTVPFYFDFSSPYGYIAAMRMDAFEAQTGRKADWRPIMIGAAMKETGNRPLVEQGMKGEYAKRDLARTAREYGIPFQVPDPFPVAALSPSRAYWWLKDRDAETAQRFALAAYRAYFGQGRNISKREVVAEVALEMKLEPQDILAATVDEDIKARLRAETQAAIDAGVFGSPFLIVDGEPFWGADRLDMAAEWAVSGGW